ncbi:hypothetical protein JXD38_04680 [candidate division WOR-3 bacterium]|nr:hypothetical protein [candidate division WOR-3 bacterium]
MNDKARTGSLKPPAARKSRRHSPWPIVIVVALPVFTVFLQLPMWVTLAVLVIGTVLLAFSPHLRGRRVSDPKKAWLQLVAYFARLQSAHEALKQSPADAVALERFEKLQAECLEMLNSRRDSEWGKEADYVTKVREEIAAMSALAPDQPGSQAPAPSREVGRLEELRRQGPLSDGEFSVLSERLRAMAADKADTVFEAVAAFQQQYREKTITEEGFHAALWDFLDNLDNGSSTVPPMPATLVQPGISVSG